MKRFVVLAIILSLVIVNAIAAEPYSRAAVIYDFDYEEDIVKVVDAVGFSWEFYGIEDYCIGDLVVMTMEDKNGTPETILDDHITNTSYSGFTVILEEGGNENE